MKQSAGRVLGLAAFVAASVAALAQSDAPVFPVSVWDGGRCLPSFSRVETVDFDRDGRLYVIASIGIHGVWLLRGEFPWRIAAAHLSCGPRMVRVLEREPAWGWAFSDCSLVERVDFLGRIDNGLHERLHVFLGK